MGIFMLSRLITALEVKTGGEQGISIMPVLTGLDSLHEQHASHFMLMCTRMRLFFSSLYGR